MLSVLLLSGGLGLFLSAVNVKLRDTMHMLELVLLAWFWMTPIVYPFMLIQQRGGVLAQLYKLNPMVWVVVTFQRALYNQAAPKSTSGPGRILILPPHEGFGFYAWHIGVVLAVSAVLFVAGLAYFGRVEGNFSEEL